MGGAGGGTCGWSEQQIGGVAAFDTGFFARGRNHIVDSIFWVFDSVHIFCW